jgi:tetratricopeptide (TPR) repeat protein
MKHQMIVVIVLSALLPAWGQPAQQTDTVNVRRNPPSLEQRLRDQLAESKGDPLLEHKLGTVVYRKGNVLEARQLWDRAAATDANLAHADVAVALELLRAGDFDAARFAIQQAAKRDLKDPHVYLARAEMAFRQRDAEQANSAMQRAYEINPKLAATNEWLGRFHQSRGDWKNAERFFRNATEHEPQRINGWLLLAGQQFKRDNISAALESFQRAEEIDRDHRLAEARLGEHYLAINDRLGAIKWYGAAVEKAPDNIPLRLMLGRIQLRLQLNERAKQEFQTVLRRREDITALTALAQIAQGERDYEAAIVLYRRALKVEPNSVVAANNLAMLLIIQSQSPDEALTLAKAAFKQNPDSPAAMSTYGCALAEAGHADEAREVLAKAVRKSPSHSWARYSYGKLLMQAKAFDLAQDQLEGCLILDPDFERKDEVEELLEKIDGERR